ncbi:MAG: TfoX/Sxy family protein [Pseudoxanthomonas sp.]
MSDSFSSYLRDLFSLLGPVNLRSMFGGQGLYHREVIIGLVIGDELFLKTDADTREAFREAGGHPFIYQGKGKQVAMSYWLPPAEAMESAQGMQPWARMAYEAALRKRSQGKTSARKAVKKTAKQLPKKPAARKKPAAD